MSGRGVTIGLGSRLRQQCRVCLLLELARIIEHPGSCLDQYANRAHVKALTGEYTLKVRPVYCKIVGNLHHPQPL